MLTLRTKNRHQEKQINSWTGRNPVWMELGVNEVNGTGRKSLGWRCRLDCEGPQALCSGIWVSLGCLPQEGVWRVLGQSVVIRAFIKRALVAVRRV